MLNGKNINDFDRPNILSNVCGDFGLRNISTFDDGSGFVDLDVGAAEDELTFGISTNAPIRGTASFSLARKQNAQYTGVSVYASMATIAPIRAGRVKFSFEYTVPTGTMIDTDMTVMMFDASNEEFLTVDNPAIKAGNSSSISRHTCYADIPANCYELRIGLCFPTTTATPFTMIFDSLCLVPVVQKYRAVYTLTTQQTFSNATHTRVNYNTKVLEIGGSAITTGASWAFVPPRNGNYLFAVGHHWAGSGTQFITSISIVQDSNFLVVLNEGNGKTMTATNDGLPLRGSAVVPLLTTQTVWISGYQQTGGNLTCPADGARTFISITEV